MLTGIVALIPAYHPEPAMVTLVEELKKEIETIVVVNDGSGEKYQEIFDKVSPSVILLNHEVNQGKGNALRTGFRYILENCTEAKGVVTLDADGQHTVEDTLNCCRTFLEHRESVVFGCRDFTSDTDIPARSRFGNRLTSKLLKYCCDIELSDTQTGLRVFPYSVLDQLIKLNGERYEYEMNMIFDLHDKGVSFLEVPIKIIYEDNNASSSFNPIKDSIRIYSIFLKFTLSSLLSVLLDLLIYTILWHILKTPLPEHYVEVSVVLSKIVAGVFNFTLNRYIFKSKRSAAGSGVRYFILWAGQTCVAALAVKGLVFLLSGFHTLCKIVVDTLLFFASFKIQQKWVFGGKKE